MKRLIVVFLSLVILESVAVGRLLVAPNRGLPIVDDGLNFLRNGGCFVPGTPVRLSAESAIVTVGGTADPTTTIANAKLTTNTTTIEDVALGTRVPDQNPRPQDYDFSFGDVDQSTWRQIDVRLRRKDGALVEMQLLRPSAWIESMGLVAGGEFTPRLSDIEIDGNAIVTAINPCPEISDGEGSVVTGRFVTRQVNNLVKVTLENGTTFTGTTTHPVWVPADQQWVMLDDLDEGQQLESLSGPLTVDAISRLADVSDVFNIEVHGHHVYRITEDGVLVHNNCLEEALKRFPNARAMDIRNLSPMAGGREFADPAKLARLGKFDWDKLDSPIVAKIIDGKTVILNGMTRVEAALRAGITHLPVEIIR